MMLITKATQQALQIGVKDVLEPRFECVRLENSVRSYFEEEERLTKTLGYSCVWPGREKKPVGYGKLQYNFSIDVQEEKSKEISIRKMTYLMWEGQIERWANWRQARTYDTDLDGNSDVIVLGAAGLERIEYQREGNNWYRYRRARCEGQVNALELSEIIEPAQEAYSLVLMMSGLLLASSE